MKIVFFFIYSYILLFDPLVHVYEIFNSIDL